MANLFSQLECKFSSSILYHKTSFVTHKHVPQCTQKKTCTCTTPIKMLQKNELQKCPKKKKHNDNYTIGCRIMINMHTIQTYSVNTSYTRQKNLADMHAFNII